MRSRSWLIRVEINEDSEGGKMMKRRTSSVYICRRHENCIFARSDTKTLNRRGSKVELCGTLERTARKEENVGRVLDKRTLYTISEERTNKR